MTREEAEQLLLNNEWAKFADARELVLLAAGLGAAAERERCARICDNLAAMSLDSMVCRGSAEECAEAIRQRLYVK